MAAANRTSCVGCDKRLARGGVRSATRVYVGGIEHVVPQSIICPHLECGVLCCVDAPACIAVFKHHCESHLLRTVDRAETHSIALFWRFCLTGVFNDASAAFTALDVLSSRHRLRLYWSSHADVRDCSECLRALGPVTFRVGNQWKCTGCFMRDSHTCTHLVAFQNDACYLRWFNLCVCACVCVCCVCVCMCV